ncbi:hypothetical protein APS56_09295 [Pseudalgibacter alginicilyticus]|uniref:Uncharacterized protein n=1 Tax=Pseudalgibacter alginicilyticus TaxID=1736674 RepID=A0A0P0DB51_9FLAO|nr:hypothetical protein [Pseudalgibacter alginicilyticus]ALJ05306.1 hypothetical protein APS56_09295 [Pseudalgibacter alginicilyticus]
MLRNIVSNLLTIIFLLFIAGPTILVMVDNTIDVSIYYTASSAEEEENSTPKVKKVNDLFSETNTIETEMFSNEDENNLEYFFKNYPKPHLNLISPPPDFHII